MRKPLVAVLGCGPAGLLALHACELHGVPAVVFSRKQKSVLGGAQYSHVPIPGIHADAEPEAILTYRVRGAPQRYRTKVYGESEVPFVSMESRRDGELVPAWNLRRLYDQLWDRYEGRVVDLDLDPRRVARFEASFDVVFSSVPLPTICMTSVDPTVQHWFRQQTVRIWNGLLEEIPDNTILYDGTEERTWYRESRIFDVGSTEWGASSPMPPLPEVRTVNKPISSNCDCHPSVSRIGRFGAWKKGILTFHAYDQVVATLAKEWGIT